MARKTMRIFWSACISRHTRNSRILKCKLVPNLSIWPDGADVRPRDLLHTQVLPWAQ